ncbi:hypothetical protein ABPG77_010868 [Micractinium sp. CCAP 211/92]
MEPPVEVDEKTVHREAYKYMSKMNNPLQKHYKGDTAPVWLAERLAASKLWLESEFPKHRDAKPPTLPDSWVKKATIAEEAGSGLAPSITPVEPVVVSANENSTIDVDEGGPNEPSSLSADDGDRPGIIDPEGTDTAGTSAIEAYVAGLAEAVQRGKADNKQKRQEQLQKRREREAAAATAAAAVDEAEAPQGRASKRVARAASGARRRHNAAAGEADVEAGSGEEAMHGSDSE